MELEARLRLRGCRVLFLGLFLLIYPVGALPLSANLPPTKSEVGLSGQHIGLAKRVLEYRLENGMKVLTVERHQAPIVAINMTYRVGSVNDRTGMTGMAHLFEHMAFKGTHTLGSREYEKERPILEEMERIDEALRKEESKGRLADSAMIQKLKERLKELDR